MNMYVDIAKESADAILLEKDLLVLEEGVVEGRCQVPHWLQKGKV
jgi:magnesium-transporting ATPase (P-type)